MSLVGPDCLPTHGAKGDGGLGQGVVSDNDGDDVLLGALHVTDDSGVSWTIKQAQKTTVAWLGFRRISAYGLNFLCSTSVFEHKGKVPGMDECRVSVSNPLNEDFLCDAHDIDPL